METAEGQFLKSCGYWIYAKSNDEAIEKAKKYKVVNTHYKVIEVVEKSDDTT